MSTDNLNKINGSKDLYDRVSTWMADIEDPESVTEDDEVVSKLDFDLYMLDEAFSIMYDIYQTCEEN